MGCGIPLIGEQSVDILHIGCRYKTHRRQQASYRTNVDTTEMPLGAEALVLNDTVSRAEDLVAQAETTDEAASVSVTTRAASCRPHPGAGPSSSTAA